MSEVTALALIGAVWCSLGVAVVVAWNVVKSRYARQIARRSASAVRPDQVLIEPIVAAVAVTPAHTRVVDAGAGCDG